MKPYLLGIPSYTLFCGLGCLFFVLFATKRTFSYKQNIPVQLLIWTVLVWMSAIGARSFYGFHVSVHSYRFMDYIYPFSQPGYALYGGLLTGTFVVWGIMKIKKLSFLVIMDQLTPCILLGIAIGRIGCLLGGCCYGKVWEGPWAIYYPVGSVPHLWQIQNGMISLFKTPLGMHPTPLYEIVVLISFCLFLLFLESRNMLKRGQLFTMGFCGYSLFRLINLWFRAEPSGDLPKLFYPILYSIIVGVSVYVFFKTSKVLPNLEVENDCNKAIFDQ